MKNKTWRIALDLLLSAMLVFEMFYTMTGNLLHELMGALFFVTLILHIVLSRKWFKGVKAKGSTGRKLTAKQKAKLIMSIALGIACTILLASSALISNVLSDFTGWQLGIDAYSWWAYGHTFCAYAVCAFTICHVGLHWVGVFRALKIPYSAERRNAINVGVTSVAALGVFALGSAATKALGILPSDAIGNHGGNSAESAPSVTPNENEIGNGSGKGTSDEQSSLDSGDMKGYGHHGYQRGQGNGQGSGNGYGNGRGYGSGSSSSIGSNGNSESLSGNGTRSENTSPNASSENSSSGSSSICTLCHKMCPLSAPRCDRPYEAGLIS